MTAQHQRERGSRRGASLIENASQLSEEDIRRITTRSLQAWFRSLDLANGRQMTEAAAKRWLMRVQNLHPDYASVIAFRYKNVNRQLVPGQPRTSHRDKSPARSVRFNPVTFTMRGPRQEVMDQVKTLVRDNQWLSPHRAIMTDNTAGEWSLVGYLDDAIRPFTIVFDELPGGRFTNVTVQHARTAAARVNELRTFWAEKLEQLAENRK
ncbi:MAG: hypothetical protein GMKNLPBB_01738 [Myxococcota bacterium]|nr:hypothetical protein [Myxococcota bacterium]